MHAWLDVVYDPRVHILHGRSFCELCPCVGHSFYELRPRSGRSLKSLGHSMIYAMYVRLLLYIYIVRYTRVIVHILYVCICTVYCMCTSYVGT